MKKITVSPLQRVHSPTSVEVMIENKKVVDARIIGDSFRGFEFILRGRDPRDAPYLTGRICGICSSAHSVASSMALEQAAGVKPPRNGIILRNLIFGADILQNHIRQIYLFSMPDYVRMPNLGPLTNGFNQDLRLSRKVNQAMVKHYFMAVEFSRLANELIILLGGKTPFNHGVLAGGGTVPPSPEIIGDFKVKLEKINHFITQVMIPDVYTLAKVYEDYYHMGVRKINFLSFGLFPVDEDDQERYFPKGVLIDGQARNFHASFIREDVSRSWYAQDGEGVKSPGQIPGEPDREKKGAYSWIKAPRYQGQALEGGPLARMWIKGDCRGISTMDRLLARALEAQEIGLLMLGWLRELKFTEPIYFPYQAPRKGVGAGLTDAMRGPLGHWVRIEKGRIVNYDIVTPTAWNFSPKDNRGQPGPVEESLLGVQVENEQEPVEICRVIRAFDLCSSCSAHVMVAGKPVKKMMIMP
ncbi:nickel-dependent hydrogenase large subunit [Desulforamulus ruminis]|uniref:nickel-dependent hydrogenase large subunit n=1 Tax=Desulforamulus ruminis TaxID=1564 RepID=UPI002FD9E2CD